MPTDYTALDAAILKSIEDGCNTQGRLVDVHRKSILKMGFKCGDETFRVVDRRLQALRKRGKIVFCKPLKTWSVATSADPA